MHSQLVAGLSAIDITPRQGQELAGYPHFPRHNTGAHDPLMASCLYLSDGHTPIAVLGLDTLFFSKKHVSRVRAAITAATGIPPQNIMICCSHSHSTPWASGRLDIESLLAGVSQDAAYIDELCQKLEYAATAAFRTAFPCQVGYARTPCGRQQNIGGNRRDPENGPCDPYAYVLSVKDLDGCVRGILANYAVHPTLLHADNTLCSADYPGYLREYLRGEYPQATLVFGLGASGDQSSRYFRTGQTFEEARRFGYTIGGAVRQAVEGAQYTGDARLAAATAPLHLNLRTLPDRRLAEENLAARKAEYDRLKQANAPYIQLQNANVALLGAEDILGYVCMQEQGLPMELVEDELPAEVMLLSIGEAKIAGMPGEVFVQVAHRLREACGNGDLMVNTVTNGGLPGYVYTREDAAQGGYEVDTSMLDEAAGDSIVAALEALYGAQRT